MRAAIVRARQIARIKSYEPRMSRVILVYTCQARNDREIKIRIIIMGDSRIFHGLEIVCMTLWIIIKGPRLLLRL